MVGSYPISLSDYYLFAEFTGFSSALEGNDKVFIVMYVVLITKVFIVMYISGTGGCRAVARPPVRPGARGWDTPSPSALGVRLGLASAPGVYPGVCLV